MKWRKDRVVVCRKRYEDFGTVVELADTDDVAKPDLRIVIGCEKGLAQNLLPNLDPEKPADFAHHQGRLSYENHHYSVHSQDCFHIV